MIPCLPLHRLFFALRPPAAAARHIHDLYGHGRRSVRADRLHVTLALLDDRLAIPAALLAAMIEVGASIHAPPFRVVFDEISGSGRNAVLRPSETVIGLEHFRRGLAGRVERAGIALRRDVRFSPHVTLHYRGGTPFAEPADPVSWRVEEFVLIESLVGWTEHVERGRWRLG